MSNFEKSNLPKCSLLLIDILNSLFDWLAINNLLNSCQKWFSNHSNIGELRTGNRILKKKSVVHHYLHTRCNLEIPVNPEVATCLEKQIKNQTYKTWQLITLHLNPSWLPLSNSMFFAHCTVDHFESERCNLQKLIWNFSIRLYILDRRNLTQKILGMKHQPHQNSKVVANIF